MRNPKRIAVVLEQLGDIWIKVPDLRLGQLLGILSIDTFNTEDYSLIDELAEKFHVKLELRERPEYWIEPNAFKELIEDIRSGKFTFSPKGREKNV